MYICITYVFIANLKHVFIDMSRKYELLSGKRTTSTLLYIPSEKNLYVKNSSMEGVQRYVCYQKVLRKNPQLKDLTPICYARLSIKNGECYRNTTPHACHDDHRYIYEDMVTANQIKNTCKQLHEILGESARAIDTRKIFNKELAK